MNSNFPKTVVITGASSGIGKACVLRLVNAGWQIFATVRKSGDGEKLVSEAGAAVTPIIMDVEDRGSISAAAKEVFDKLQRRGLDGLSMWRAWAWCGRSNTRRRLIWRKYLT
jgi:NAD(P)-dependent dehydrogenase (short-subunit alcohol dehydrogenase family)